MPCLQAECHSRCATYLAHSCFTINTTLPIVHFIIPTTLLAVPEVPAQCANLTALCAEDKVAEVYNQVRE